MTALYLAPFVIAQRLPQLWFEALHPNPLVCDESRLAVTEKVEAFAASLMAGQRALMVAPMAMAADLLAGRSPLDAAMGAQKRIARAASRPIERRLRHNLKRLSRR